MRVVGLTSLGESALLLASQLRKQGVTVVGYDPDDARRKRGVSLGVVTTSSLQAVALHLPQPKMLWVIPPLGSPADKLLRQLTELVAEGDLVVDWTSSNMGEKQKRHAFFQKKKILYLGCDLKAARQEQPFVQTGDAVALELSRPLFEKLFVVIGRQ